jgi:tartrate dehydratase beta subunit/fumarate hydratase class I family protein
MMNGSLRTVRAPAQLPSVGDVVEINGDALTLRDGF